MLKNLIILFILLLSVNCFAIPYNSQDNYKLEYPKYIPIHSSFDISLITSNPYSAAGRLIFYIIPADGISLNTINLNNISENLKLNFTSTIMTNLNVPAYKTIIDLSDTSISSGTYFQILMNFYSDDKLSANLRFYGIYMKADSVLGYLSNNAVTRYESLTNQLLEAPLKFYSPNKNAGKSLLIEKYSIFQIPLNNFSSNNLLVEFWVKLNKQGTEILTVKNKINSTELFKFFTSSFQTLSVTSNYSRQDYLYPVFMSNKSWYHISILFSYKKHETYFYCNGQLISKNRLKDLTSLDNLELEFGDMNQGRAFQIDLLRFIDLHNSIDVSFRNKNYRNFRADSSTVLAQLNFDHLDEVASQIAKLNIFSSDTKLVKSDAPIFTRAPEINISILGNSYELEWKGGDYKQAYEYVLQKSTNKSKFIDIFTFYADTSISKDYSYLDSKNKNSDVVFYRVKQVNLDGSIVYSSSLKVGQGKIRPFILGQNYPNPFNPKTSINIDLLQDSNVKITIYNLEGKEIDRLFEGHLGRGMHRFSFDASDLPSGVYLYKVSTPTYTEIKKMIFTK